jgi:hypothetical protein
VTSITEIDRRRGCAQMMYFSATHWAIAHISSGGQFVRCWSAQKLFAFGHKEQKITVDDTKVDKVASIGTRQAKPLPTATHKKRTAAILFLTDS